METLPRCRICLIKDVRMHCLVNTDLQEIYELLTGKLLETRDRRPVDACYVCCARLRNCLQLRSACLHSEELFTHLLDNDDFEVKPLLSTLHTIPATCMSVDPVLHRELLPNLEPSPTTGDQLDEEHVGDLEDDIVEQGMCTQLIKQEDMKCENSSSEDAQLHHNIRSIGASDDNCLEDDHSISSLLQQVCKKTVKIVLHRVDLNSIGKENMSHLRWPVLDSVSENTSGSSVISLIPSIKISDNDRIRYGYTVAHSDNTNDTLIENSELFNRSEQSQTSNAVENEKETEVSLLMRSKCHDVYDNQGSKYVPNHNDFVDVSGIPSLMNISDLSDNITSNISMDVPQLFPDATSQDIQIVTALTDSDVGDFSPSDESDFDPKKAGYDSDDSLNKSFDDKYYDDPVIVQLKKKRNRKVKRLQERNTEVNSGERSQNLPTNEVLIEGNRDSREGNVEKKTNKMTSKRKWDRRNACFYCQAIVTNYTRHLLRNHADKTEVLQYKAINDTDPKIRKLKRQEITNKLRNEGNFLHNSKASFDRDVHLTLLPSKRSNQGTSSPSSYAICKTCLGTFKRSSFFRHLKNCKASENVIPSLKRKALFNHSLTIVSNTANASIELKEKIISHLRSDEISLVVKNDPLIIAYGARLLKKKKERRSRKAICSKMRDLATLLILLRKKDKTIENLTDAIDPEKYETFVSAIKEMCGFDEQTGQVKIISVPARMRPAVLGCIEVLYTHSIMQNESTAYKEANKKKLDDFKYLIEINWEISSNAEKSKKRNHLTKENVMTLDTDIKTVMEKIHKIEIKYASKLRKDRCVLNYELLCMVTIAHIMMIDRQRSGDVAEAQLTFYINRKNEEVPEKVWESLTVQQRKCIKDLDVFQIPGKRTRGVPILLTKVMRENIDLIIACREDLKIPSSNQYLFARPGTQEPFEAGKCLDMIKKQCNLKRPEMITSTGMRHHIATMSQIHAKQNDHYTEQLAGFLGHNISAHAQNYRLPMQVLQKAVVGSQLLEYENTLSEKNDHRIETITSQSYQEIENFEEEAPSSKNPAIESDQPNILPINSKISIETPETTVNNNMNEIETGDYNEVNNKKPDDQSNQDPKNKDLKMKRNRSTTETKWSSSTSESDSDDGKPIQKRSKTRRTKEKNIYDKNSKNEDKNIKPNNRKVKTKCPSSSSDSDNSIKKRQKSTHRKWSHEEIKLVKKHLQSYINKKVNPGKSKCMEILRKEPILENRTWMQLNTYVNNIYKKK